MRLKSISWISVPLVLCLLGNDASAFCILTDPSQPIDVIYSNPFVNQALSLSSGVFGHVGPNAASTVQLDNRTRILLQQCEELRNTYRENASMIETIDNIETMAHQLTAEEVAFITGLFPVTAGFFNRMSNSELPLRLRGMAIQSFLRFSRQAVHIFHHASRIPGTSIIVLRANDEISLPEGAIRLLSEALEFIKQYSPPEFQRVTEETKVIRLESKSGSVASTFGKGITGISWPVEDITELPLALIEEADHNRFMRNFADDKLVQPEHAFWVFPIEFPSYGGPESALPARYLAEIHAAFTLVEFLDSVVLSRKFAGLPEEQTIAKKLEFEKRKLRIFLGVLLTIQHQRILTDLGENILSEINDRTRNELNLVPVKFNKDDQTVSSQTEGKTLIGRLFLWFGVMVEEISHGLRGEWAGFTVRWNTLSTWRNPGIDLDEMDSEHYEGPRSEIYHRHALGVAQAGLKGNFMVSTILAGLEMAGVLVLGQGRIGDPLGIALAGVGLLLGATAIASSLTVAFGNMNRLEKNSDTQRALYHRQELQRIENGTKSFGKTGKQLYALGLGLMWNGRSRPYLAGQEADYAAPTDQEIEDYLRFAYANLSNRHGQVMLDTAAAYGPSEERMGRILRAHPEWLQSSFIATKGGEEWDPQSGKSTLKQLASDLVVSFERSLSRLGKVDLFYVHQATLKVLQDDEAMNALRQLVATRRGGLEMLGLSISRPDVLEEIINAARTDPTLLKDINVFQLPTRLFLDRPDLIQFLRACDIAIVLNRPNLASTNVDQDEFFRALAARPEVSVILGGGRTHLQETAGYFNSSLPIPTPSIRRVASNTPTEYARPARNRLRLFRALKAGDFAAAQALVETAYNNSYFVPALNLKVANLNNPAHRKTWMETPMGRDVSGIKYLDFSTPAYPPALDPLGIDSLQRDKTKTTGVGDLLVFAYKAGEVLETRFYRVRQAQYTESVSDLDEPTYSFVLEDMQTGQSLTLQQSDWHEHGGDPAYNQRNFYWLGTVDDVESEVSLLNVQLHGNLSANLGLSPRKNMGLTFKAGETVMHLMERVEHLSGLFHKPGILLPQTHFYLNGKTIDPSYRLKTKDRYLTVQVLDYFRFSTPGRIGPILMSVLAIAGLVNQWIGSHILSQHNHWHHHTILIAAA